MATELRQKLETARATTRQITLYAAAALASTSQHIGVSCNCRIKCIGRCRCIRNKVKCSIHCHTTPDHECGNLAPLTTRTKMTLVDHTAI